MRKINILVIPSDHSGVYFFRSLRPHTKLQEMYGNDFDVTIDHNPDFNDLKSFDKYDIIHVHKGYYRNQEPFNKALNYWKENNITTILDIDDHWDVGRLHPLYSMMQRLGVDKIIIENLKNFDYITTTTDIFANQIKKYNKNVFVFPNAIDSTEKQFIPQDIKSDKIRFGFIMGSSHKHDIELVRGMVDKLPNDILDKIQIVLCGFDTRGTISKIDKETGEITNRNIKPQESVWCYYEQIVTNNYKIISPEYKEFLFNYIPNSVWPNEANETYRRCWTKNINEYATHYNNIDVLLAPLVESDFNKVKSQLKVI